LLSSSKSFHVDVRLATLKDLQLPLRQEVRQKTQNRSHGTVGWQGLHYLRLFICGIEQKGWKGSSNERCNVDYRDSVCQGRLRIDGRAFFEHEFFSTDRGEKQSPNAISSWHNLPFGHERPSESITRYIPKPNHVPSFPYNLLNEH
jgi:hypothetical protein